MLDDPGATHFYGDGCDEAHGSWANMEQALETQRALADDLADVLDRIIEAADDDGNVEAVEANEIARVLARYREARNQ